MPRQPKPPPELVDALMSGRLVAVVGSGLSMASGGPGWDELLLGVAAGIEETRPDKISDLAHAVKAAWRDRRVLDAADLMKAILGHRFASRVFIELKSRRIGLEVDADALNRALQGERVDSLFVTYRPGEPNPLKPNVGHHILAQLPFRAILTTNYDNLLERVLPEAPRYSRGYPELPARVQEGRFLILKLHGDQDHPDDLVLARSDYQAALNDHRLRSALQALLQSNQFFWLGYGHNDPHLDRYLDAAAGLGLSGGFALVRGGDPVTLRRLETVSITPWIYERHEELPDLLQALAAAAGVKLKAAEPTKEPPKSSELADPHAAFESAVSKLGASGGTVQLSAAELGALLEQVRAGQGAILRGPGTIVQGDRNVVAGPGGVAVGGNVSQSVLLAVERLVFGEVAAEPPASNLPKLSERQRKLLSRYLNRLIAEKSRIDLTGIDPGFDAANSPGLELSAVYVALETLRGRETTERERLRHPLKPEDDRISALEFVSMHPCVALLGDPGSGKTTFANFLATCLAGERLGREDLALGAMGEDWKAGPLLPLTVSLRHFAARLRPDSKESEEEQFWSFLEGHFGEELAGVADYLQTVFEADGGIIVLDGLDEVPEAQRRRRGIQNCVVQLKRRFRKCKILLTCRTYAYERQDWAVPGFEAARLAPFSDQQIGTFVERWYGYDSRNHLVGFRVASSPFTLDSEPSGL